MYLTFSSWKKLPIGRACTEWNLVFRSNDPAVYTRAQLGANLNAAVHSNVNINPTVGQAAIPQSYKRGEAIADYRAGREE